MFTNYDMNIMYWIRIWMCHTRRWRIEGSLCSRLSTENRNRTQYVFLASYDAYHRPILSTKHVLNCEKLSLQELETQFPQGCREHLVGTLGWNIYLVFWDNYLWALSDSFEIFFVTSRRRRSSVMIMDDNYQENIAYDLYTATCT